MTKHSDFEALKKTILERRTSKDFNGEPVTREQIDSLLELAVWAPNHRLNEPWRFRIVWQNGIHRLITHFQNQLPGDDLTLFTKNFEKLTRVGAILYLTSLKDEMPLMDWENYAACSAAAQNVLLGATALGLQSYWNTGRMMTHPETMRFLEIPESERFVGALWIGHSDQKPTRTRTPVCEKCIWIE